MSVGNVIHAYMLKPGYWCRAKNGVLCEVLEVNEEGHLIRVHWRSRVDPQSILVPPMTEYEAYTITPVRGFLA